MAPTLDGARAKRDRAAYHLEVIERCINDFINSNPYPLSIERYPEQGIYQARVVNPKEFPAKELALLIGDCVHNMRSALDYIAWELAGGNLADMETMYPIFETEAGFRKRGVMRIKNIPPEPRALIERCQPYHLKNGFHALTAIAKLDAADKHKLLTVTAAISREGAINIHIPAHVESKSRGDTAIFHQNLKHDAIVARLTVTPPLPEMQVDIVSIPTVIFGTNLGLPPNAFVVDNLHSMLGEVDFSIREFGKFF